MRWRLHTVPLIAECQAGNTKLSLWFDPTGNRTRVYLRTQTLRLIDRLKIMVVFAFGGTSNWQSKSVFIDGFSLNLHNIGKVIFSITFLACFLVTIYCNFLDPQTSLPSLKSSLLVIWEERRNASFTSYNPWILS